MSEFKKGDRVRVTIEGEVQRAFDSGALWLPGGLGSTVDPDHIVSIEKIEPPVETFGPGDFVQSKRIPEFTHLILNDGYVDLLNKVYKPSPQGYQFTSDKYTKIELTEAPF